MVYGHFSQVLQTGTEAQSYPDVKKPNPFQKLLGRLESTTKWDFISTRFERSTQTPLQATFSKVPQSFRKMAPILSRR